MLPSPTHDTKNELLTLAAEVVNHTSCNLFLTGKAGTGKTTFLRYIKEHTHKNTVVVAPTGVAAINAGGVTMHSLFQLPFIPYLPEQNSFSANVNFVNRPALLKGLRLSSQKIDLLRELELLIMDEVSMLRADMLDAIDEILRYVRQKRNLPFGGVQVLFIGDLFQLPPVVKEDEVEMLNGHYASPFFFSAKVLEQHPPLFIELKKIYRQNEQQFISLLNNIRNNQMSEHDFDMLHQRYRPRAIDIMEESITLTTHNYMADNINQRELKKLAAPLQRFTGEISGNFSEKALPTEMELNLKEGSQVMFIKNDSSPEKRYFNGKLARIRKIKGEEIWVTLSGNGRELLLEKEKWKNVQYVLNKETGKVEEEELGSFTQYPVHLAWAITIHKSQGLTFDNAVIDAGKSFAAGQVYVALSRCRTLDGLLLLSRIEPGSVKSDERIIAFARRENGLEEIKEILSGEKPKYAAQLLMRTFDWKKIVSELEQLEALTKTKKIPEREFAEKITEQILQKAKEQSSVAEKFIAELEKRFAEIPLSQSWLNTKVTGAKNFFAHKIKEELVAPLNSLQSFLQGKTKVRKYTIYVNEVENILWTKIKDIQRAAFGALTFEISPIERRQIAVSVPRKKKEEKGSSQLETLQFYKQGMKPAEIARQRGMAVSTIEGHLAELVKTKEVNVFDFLNEEQLEKIKDAAEKAGYEQLSPIKAEVGDAISYGQIRMALNYLRNLF